MARRMIDPNPRIIAELKETAQRLSKSGLISARTLKSISELAPAPLDQLDSEDIRRLRKRERLSQAALAMYLNLSLSTVRQWESGAKRPSGAALKLLHLLDRRGLDGIT